MSQLYGQSTSNAVPLDSTRIGSQVQGNTSGVFQSLFDGASAKLNKSTLDGNPGAGPVPIQHPHSGPQPRPTLVHRICESLRDKFGLKKQYYTRDGQLPTRDPDDFDPSTDAMDVAPIHDDPNVPGECDDLDSTNDVASNGNPSGPFGPFPNRIAFEIGDWYWSSGPQKTQKDFERLLEIITADDYSPECLKGLNWRRLNAHLGGNKANEDLFKDGEGEWIDDDGWRTTPIHLKIPFHSRQVRPGNEHYTVGPFYHRSIVEVLKEKIANTEDERLFHYEPFRMFWKASVDSPEVRVYSELYNSDAFWEAHKEIQDPLKNPECTLPRVVVGLMFWSDQTHLTSFGASKIWPLYMCFGNESKYRRAKPTSNLFQHIAYFETLPDSVKDFITQRTGGALPDGLMSFLNRELLHLQWSVLLDDELVDAIENGIVILCPDGIRRRFYIRIFTYSADYPEKISLASMRRGACPCPRCLTPRAKFHNMGLPEDMTFREENPRRYGETEKAMVVQARERIFEDGVAAYGTVVGGMLNSHGLLPVENAFATKLGKVGFDICSALVVDLLHEFEIGVWKDLFMHLVRILETLKPSSKAVHVLDHRYRLVPSYSQTIRTFASNTSRMTRKAARDYEDALQCAIPTFEDLFPAPHDSIISKLLYLCCQWHALAKLRLHTDYTINMLEETTVALGNQFRLFMNETCNSIETYELPREAEARQRRATKKKLDQRVQETGALASNALSQQESSVEAGERVRGATDSNGPSEARGPSAVIATTTPLESHIGDLGNAPPQPPPPPPGPSSSTRTTRSQTRNQASSGEAATVGSAAQLSAPQSSIKKAGRLKGTTKAREKKGKGKVNKKPRVGAEGERSTTAGACEEAGEADSSTSDPSSTTRPSVNGQGRRPKRLNLSTVKYHAMADYAQMIRWFGPCDLYTTEGGELQHRCPKSWYRRTNRQKVAMQMSKIERRRARLRKLRQNQLPPEVADFKSMGAKSPQLPYNIGASQSSSYPLSDFAQNGAYRSDLACDHFIYKLKNFIHTNFRDILHEYVISKVPSYQGDPNDLERPQDWTYISVKDNRLYSHKTMRINYSTYDMRRDCDYIHVNTENRNSEACWDSGSFARGFARPKFSTTLRPRDVRDDHPSTEAIPDVHLYRYARVLGIFHVKLEVGKYLPDIPDPALYDGQPMQMDILWVQWYRHKTSPSAFRLDTLELAPLSDLSSTTFIRPKDVVRACHIIPRFSRGRSNPNGYQISKFARNENDWNEYYVNRFVDRDMFMRYLWGHAIGHEYTRARPLWSLTPNLLPRDALNEVEMDNSLVQADASLSDDEMASIADSERMDVDWEEGDDDGCGMD